LIVGTGLRRLFKEFFPPESYTTVLAFVCEEASKEAEWFYKATGFALGLGSSQTIDHTIFEVKVHFGKFKQFGTAASGKVLERTNQVNFIKSNTTFKSKKCTKLLDLTVLRYFNISWRLKF
jgi:hypothetical protein